MTEFEHQARERVTILKRLRDLASETDREAAHAEADDLLLRYLELIGAGDLVEAYRAAVSVAPESVTAA